MQIRVGNRQDEPLVRAIFTQALEELGIQFDLDGRDKDLRNIELNYIWHDGVFLVAEDDGRITGAAGARRRDNEQTLELSRLVVASTDRNRKVARKLLESVIFFAGGLEYNRLTLPPESKSCEKALESYRDALTRMGFILDAESGRWTLSVTPRILR